MRQSRLTFVLAAALVLACTACSSAAPGSQEQKQASTEAASVQAIYKSSCLACHGDQLQGGMGPGLQKVGTRLDKEQIVAKIQHGGGGMPSYSAKLRETDIQALAEWLAEQ
ncbi:c-type cytochrome [Paenibacillus puerhi]|uniref:c-type cytochrome n=1 Tax=Paenibacillus puerhi TaxID=2692622 RepID=UPI001359E739|nr:cytochrome c [Paenibacillus puerhi]